MEVFDQYDKIFFNRELSTKILETHRKLSIDFSTDEIIHVYFSSSEIKVLITEEVDTDIKKVCIWLAMLLWGYYSEENKYGKLFQCMYHAYYGSGMLFPYSAKIIISSHKEEKEKRGMLLGKKLSCSLDCVLMTLFLTNTGKYLLNVILNCRLIGSAKKLQEAIRDAYERVIRGERFYGIEIRNALYLLFPELKGERKEWLYIPPIKIIEMLIQTFPVLGRIIYSENSKSSNTKEVIISTGIALKEKDYIPFSYVCQKSQEKNHYSLIFLDSFDNTKVMYYNNCGSGEISPIPTDGKNKQKSDQDICLIFYEKTNLDFETTYGKIRLKHDIESGYTSIIFYTKNEKILGVLPKPTSKIRDVKNDHIWLWRRKSGHKTYKLLGRMGL